VLLWGASSLEIIGEGSEERKWWLFNFNKTNWERERERERERQYRIATRVVLGSRKSRLATRGCGTEEKRGKGKIRTSSMRDTCKIRTVKMVV
jgi:hypothetical protein